MKKKLLNSLRMLLVAAGLCVGGTSAWAQRTAWTYASSGNVFGTEFNGSKAGIMTIQLGISSEVTNWGVENFHSRNRGVRHSSQTTTMSSEDGQGNIPVSGNFVILRPVVDVVMSATIYAYGKSWLYLVDEDNSKTTITSSRTNNNQQTGTATLTAGKTYYVYGDNNVSNFAFVSFTATTIELYYLEKEITAAQSLYDDVDYAEGKTTLNSAITTANSIATNNELTSDDYINGRKALLEAEGVFLAANGNRDFIVSSDEYLYCGRHIKSVNGIVMTLGGKEGTDTWYNNSSNLTGTYTGNAYTRYLRTSTYGTDNGSRCNGSETVNKLPNQGTYFTFEPTMNGVLTLGMLYCANRNMFFADSEKKILDVFNPGTSNYYGERSYKVEAGKTYYLWQDNNQYAALYGFHFVSTNLSNIVGDVNFSTGYLAETTDKVTLKPGESYHYRFVNYNKNGDNWWNWHLPVYKSDDSRPITLRVDWWDDMNGSTDAEHQRGFSTDATNYWDNVPSKIKGVIVDMSVTFTADKKFVMTSNNTATDGTTWTYNYTSDNGNNIDLTGEDYIKVALSVNTSWLEVLSESRTAVAVTLGTNGYATFASSCPLDLTTANLPAGLTAYKAAVSGTTVTFSPLDQTVPANTGILLQGENSESYIIPVASSGTTVEGNAFLVNDGGTTFAADADYYYFGLMKNTLTFGQFDPASVAIPADKAYLKVLKSSIDSPSRQLTVMFGGDVSGINTVQGGSTVTDSYYNLNGQRVSKPANGLYIVNGKKVIIK